MLVSILIKHIMYSPEIYSRRPESDTGKFHCFIHVSLIVVVVVVVLGIVSRANRSIYFKHIY